MEERAENGADVQVILKRNFFDSEETEFQASVETDAETTEVKTPSGTNEAVKTSLNITLISTLSWDDGKDERSSCVIKNSSEEQVYRVGSKESFAPNTKIVRILPKRVDFINGDRLEYVELLEFAKGAEGIQKPQKLDGTSLKDRVARSPDGEETSTGEIQGDGTNFQIPRSLLENSMSNLPDLYTKIRLVPYKKDGKEHGFKILSITPGSVFNNLGLKRRDVLVRINGNELTLATVGKLFTDLKNESNFTLDVERNSAEQTLNYEVVD